MAQEKRRKNSFKREKVNNQDHAHILSGILKCPCCGKSMYGNIAKAHSKDKKTRYYYYCKNTVTPTGHECSFHTNIEAVQYYARSEVRLDKINAVQQERGKREKKDRCKKLIALQNEKTGWTAGYRNTMRASLALSR